MLDAKEIEERYRKITSQIPSSVCLIAVSKTQPAQAIEILYRLGHRDFGENYVQELIEKQKTLEPLGIKDIRWHLIGHLQTNKVKSLMGIVNAIHSVDSLKLAQEISKRQQTLDPGKRLPIFLEINIDQEHSKSGMAAADTPRFAKEISQLPGLQIEGLMCIPSPKDPSQNAFLELKNLSQQLGSLTQGKLSMGMTQDYQSAIQCGSTHVRVGTALFGQRPFANSV